MGNPGLTEAQAGIKIARRKINNLRYPNDTTLMAESEDAVPTNDIPRRGSIHATDMSHMPRTCWDLGIHE